MGFWSEYVLQVYRAVMFPWHWLMGLEAYAEDLNGNRIRDLPERKRNHVVSLNALGIDGVWWCSGLPQQDCPDCQAYGNCPTCSKS